MERYLNLFLSLKSQTANFEDILKLLKFFQQLVEDGKNSFLKSDLRAHLGDCGQNAHWWRLFKLPKFPNPFFKKGRKVGLIFDYVLILKEYSSQPPELQDYQFYDYLQIAQSKSVDKETPFEYVEAVVKRQNLLNVRSYFKKSLKPYKTPKINQQISAFDDIIRAYRLQGYSLTVKQARCIWAQTKSDAK